MTTENSTPASAPGKDTAQVEELIRSESFLDEISGNLAKIAAEPVQKINSSNRMEAVESANQNTIEQSSVESELTEIKEPKAQETLGEELPVAPVETPAAETEEQPETIEKRWKDAQSMIGRQSNEIGELRKMVSEMKQKKEVDQAVKQPPQETTEPYYERVVKASENDLAQVLMKDAQQRGEDIEPGLALQQARFMKTNAQMQLDIIADKMKPLEKMSQEIENQKVVAQKDADWYAAHPDYKNRQQAMNQFISKAYPDGLQMKDDVGNVIGMRADPYEVAHMAYEFAETISSSAQAAAEQQNNQRIASGRSLNTSTQGAVPSQTITQKPKQDPLAAESSRVFEQIAPALVRGR